MSDPVRPELTMREAAEACSVSFSTIRRRREANAFPNARQDSRGWVIPVGDLLAAGLRVNAPAPPDRPSEVDDSSTGAGGRGDPGELTRANHALELAHAEIAHLRQANALQAANLADVRRALLALTAGAGPAGDPERAHVPAQSEPVERPAQRPSDGPNDPAATSGPERAQNDPQGAMEDREEPPPRRRRRWWPARP